MKLPWLLLWAWGKGQILPTTSQSSSPSYLSLVHQVHTSSYFPKVQWAENQAPWGPSTSSFPASNQGRLIRSVLRIFDRLCMPRSAQTSERLRLSHLHKSLTASFVIRCWYLNRLGSMHYSIFHFCSSLHNFIAELFCYPCSLFHHTESARHRSGCGLSCTRIPWFKITMVPLPWFYLINICMLPPYVHIGLNAPVPSAV